MALDLESICAYGCFKGTVDGDLQSRAASWGYIVDAKSPPAVVAVLLRSLGVIGSRLFRIIGG